MRWRRYFLVGILGLAAVVHADESAITLRILAFDRPQTKVEQGLAEKEFTAKTGIKVVFETQSPAFLRAKLAVRAGGKGDPFDLIHYDARSLGLLVEAGVLERLDTGFYLGNDATYGSLTNLASATDDVIAPFTNALSFAMFRPEVSYRVGRYPTSDALLYQRNFVAFDATPVFGLPWATEAQVLAYRVDLVEGSFAKVQPSVAEFYQNQIRPNWDKQWRMFTPAAGLVQIVNPQVRATCIRGKDVLLDFLPILWSFGGELWNEGARQVEGVLNSPSNVKALESFCEWNLKRKIIAPESLEWSDDDAWQALARGKVAMGQFWPRHASALEDPGSALPVGRYAFAMVPGNTAVNVFAKPGAVDKDGITKGALNSFGAQTSLQRVALDGSVGIGIDSASTRKEAAWKYLEWLFSTTTQLAILFDKQSNFLSARRDLAAENRAARAVNKTVSEIFELGMVRGSWNEPSAPQYEAILAREVMAAFRGEKSPKNALDDAAKEIQELVRPLSSVKSGAVASAPKAAGRQDR